MPARNRIAVSALVAVMASLALVAATPSAARAADGLMSAEPADGSALSAPGEVRLTFTAAPDPAASHMAVYDSTRSRLNSGPLAVSGRDGLRQPVQAATRGDVVVAYHVTLVNGDELTGQVRFSVGTGVTPAQSGGSAANAATAAVAGHRHDVDPVSASALALGSIVLIGAVVLLVRPPVRRPELDDLDEKPDPA